MISLFQNNISTSWYGEWDNDNGDDGDDGVDGNNGDDIDFIKAGRGGGFDDNIVLGGEESGAEESRQGEEHSDLLKKELLPLQSIFDFAYIVVRVVNNGKEGWECRWCNKVFIPKHALRALHHILKI